MGYSSPIRTTGYVSSADVLYIDSNITTKPAGDLVAVGEKIHITEDINQYSTLKLSVELLANGYPTSARFRFSKGLAAGFAPYYFTGESVWACEEGNPVAYQYHEYIMTGLEILNFNDVAYELSGSNQHADVWMKNFTIYGTKTPFVKRV